MKGTFRYLQNVIEDRCDFDTAYPDSNGNTCVIINPGSDSIYATGQGVHTCTGIDYGPQTGKPSNCTGLSTINVAVPAARRQYISAEIVAKKRIGQNFWGQASFIWSNLKGNYDGAARIGSQPGPGNGQTDPGINADYDYATMLNNAYGKLNLDRPYAFRLDGAYTWPFGLTLGLSAFVYSGAPRNQMGYFNSQYGSELFLIPRGTNGREDTLFDANLSVQYALKLSAVTVTLFAQGYNLINDQTITGRDTNLTVLPPGQPEQPDLPLCRGQHRPERRRRRGAPGPAPLPFRRADQLLGRLTLVRNCGGGLRPSPVSFSRGNGPVARRPSRDARIPRRALVRPRHARRPAEGLRRDPRLQRGGEPPGAPPPPPRGPRGPRTGRPRPSSSTTAPATARSGSSAAPPSEHPGVVKVVELVRNAGQHMAILAAFTATDGEYVITIDADLQNPPEEIPKLVAEMDAGHDVVGTVRQSRHDPFFRRVASRLVNRTTALMTGMKLNDYGCMLRGYHRDVVDVMLASDEASTFIPALAQQYARSPVEIPVAHAERTAGTSTYSLYRLVR